MVRLTYIARSGREIPLSSESDCASAIRAGELHRESLVMDGRTGRWMKAAENSLLAGLLDRIRVASPGRPARTGLKAATVTAWLLALIVPPALAWAIAGDPLRVLPRSLLYAIALAAPSAALGIYVKSRRGRWRLALLVAILALAAGLWALAESTGGWRAGLVPAVTGLFAPRPK